MLYGVEQTIAYLAWDTANNEGETGDVGNHTLRWIKDGASAAPTNAPSEVDATNAPGVYKITLTAAECQALDGTLAGASSTADVSIVPRHFAMVRLPNAAPAANGGLPTVDADNYVMSHLKKVDGTAVQSTNGELHVLDGDGNAVAPASTALSSDTWTAAKLAKLVSFASGKVVISGGVLSFYDAAGTSVLFTLTPSATGRAVT